MRDLGAWVAQRRREAQAAAPLDAHLVTPSLRDLGAALRTGRRDLVGIPTVSPADDAAAAEAAGWAAAADVAAVAVELGGSFAAVRALSERLSTTPLLLLDPIVAEGQVLASRLAGADAVALPVGSLGEGELRRLAEAARSTLMSPVFAIRTGGEWEVARRLDARFLLVSAPDGALTGAVELARHLSPRVSACLWADGLDSPAALRALVGSADGALLGTACPASCWPDLAVLEPEQ